MEELIKEYKKNINLELENIVSVFEQLDLKSYPMK